jgi:hypothetical protein
MGWAYTSISDQETRYAYRFLIGKTFGKKKEIKFGWILENRLRGQEAVGSILGLFAVADFDIRFFEL